MKPLRIYFPDKPIITLLCPCGAEVIGIRPRITCPFCGRTWTSIEDEEQSTGDEPV